MSRSIHRRTEARLATANGLWQQGQVSIRIRRSLRYPNNRTAPTPAKITPIMAAASIHCVVMCVVLPNVPDQPGVLASVASVGSAALAQGNTFYAQLRQRQFKVRLQYLRFKLFQVCIRHRNKCAVVSRSPLLVFASELLGRDSGFYPIESSACPAVICPPVVSHRDRRTIESPKKNYAPSWMSCFSVAVTQVEIVSVSLRVDELLTLRFV